ncbi:MAG: hypothetical protein NUV54_02065 [Candidatus Taylorbacteria bacterium]|nr:hypothetical protein [Candidatus Taylorbacteria bacterium]
MEKSSRLTVIGGAVALAVLLGILFYSGNLESGPGRLDAFAKCLTEKGSVFYGAFWCPHCQTQKKMFDTSKQFLPYVECSSPNGQTQLEICKENEITSYPTWVFADLSRLTGEVALETLAEKTGCILPTDDTEAPINN